MVYATKTECQVNFTWRSKDISIKEKTYPVETTHYLYMCLLISIFHIWNVEFNMKYIWDKKRKQNKRKKWESFSPLSPHKLSLSRLFQCPIKRQIFMTPRNKDIHRVPRYSMSNFLPPSSLQLTHRRKYFSNKIFKYHELYGLHRSFLEWTECRFIWNLLLLLLLG